MVDWETAVRIGTRFAGQGPEVSRDEADAVVAELRAGAELSTPLVREFTGLTAAERTAPVLVVDRPGWVRANAEGFATILQPVVERLTEKKGVPGPVAQMIGSRVTGAEVGLLLGFMGSKVLGQFDPFHGLEGSSGRSGSASSGPAAHGRLLLVAPNIVHVEREIDADPTDFRLWVCLHEETHRVQFTAVPWMRDHLLSEMDALVGSVEPTRALEDGFAKISEALRGGGSLLDLVSTPEQREVVDRITGVMSLLEGHADVVMDGVGPEVIPTVADIRRRFTERRKGVGVLDKVLRRLLGLDAKMAQYRDGAIFVRGVVGDVGMEGFNAVWAEPGNLPSKAEIADPSAWVARVHG
ncbi:zinc-dependent metalloprotease [Nocardioides sp. MJB4]|uniref:Zinc-dependent metalloprotease n=2 Tax=Nocardioides donggukensis TaxID=2774019 RepID=A0A927KAS1_9ACTN|nr:zinc-dependent metalloprotease [Nocardioides donggukensis]